jgi:hypothetical protein
MEDAGRGRIIGKIQARTHLQFVGGEKMEAMISRLRGFFA